jgi:hypothetical protein
MRFVIQCGTDGIPMDDYPSAAYAYATSCAIPVVAASAQTWTFGCPVRPGDIPFLYTNYAIMAMRHLGISVPQPCDYPDALKPFLERNIHASRLDDIHALCASWMPDVRHRGVFIKPAKMQKLFTGMVFSRIEQCRFLRDFPADTDIWVSEVVPWESEWRVHIHKRTPIGISHYRGNPMVLPDRKRMADMIDAWNGPVAYAIDIGVRADTGRTCLIEVNDGWSLGMYGCDPHAYVRAMVDRWNEVSR